MDVDLVSCFWALGDRFLFGDPRRWGAWNKCSHFIRKSLPPDIDLDSPETLASIMRKVREDLADRPDCLDTLERCYAKLCPEIS